MTSRLGDRFEIQAELGRGGFGQVFRAFDPVMNRIVAIKILTSTEDPNSFARFINEAIAAGNLHHENIVTVYDSGQQGKTPYIVMEYLDGEDLQHIIKNNSPFSLYQKLRIMDQVANGLHCAHRHGVVHRDVKPANVMILKDGTAKIMDFGIARLVRDTSTRLTQQGYLVGTILYMAPELFSGPDAEVDSICDVWSYGVILYEFLVGKNPFQTGNLQSEMYRIVNEDAPPIARDICPPELQIVVQKLLSRQRASRYRSLEDTRFDLQMVLRSIEKAEVDRLLSNAQQHIFQQQWADALATAREARTMDPQNGTARIIMDRAQRELDRLSLQPRIDDLVRRSKDFTEKRRLTEAVSLLEEALRLDTGNEMVQGRIQDLRILKTRVDDAAKLVIEADREFKSKRLTSAFECASEAVSLDPGNLSGKELFENIRREIEVRETERAVEAEVRRARGLMAVDDLKAAMEALRVADSRYPGHATVGDLITRIEQLVEERERRQDLARRLDHAKDTVRQARFEDAVRELDELLKLFPDAADAADLRKFAQQEQRAKRRSEEVSRIVEAAGELNRAKKFPEALRMLEDGIAKYPDDLGLPALYRSTHAEKLQLDRERVLEAGLKRCQSLRERKKWQEALDLLPPLLVEFQNSREVLDLEAVIRQEKALAERSDAIGAAKKEAEKLLRERKPDAAADLLKSAILSYDAERELIPTLESVKQVQSAERERHYIESELKHAKGFEARGDLTISLKIIENALDGSPNSSELLQAKERLLGDIQRAGRELKISEEAAAIKEAIQRKEWPKVQEKVEAATLLFPSEAIFTRLDGEARRQRDEHLNQLVREGRSLLESGRVGEAEEFVSANLLQFRDVDIVQSLGGDIVAEKRRREREQVEHAAKARAVADCLQRSRDREGKGDLAGALDALERGLQQYRDEADLTGALKRVKEKIAAAKQAGFLASIDDALSRSNWSLALQLIGKAGDYATDPALIPRQAKALDQRRVFFESSAAAIRGHLAHDQLNDDKLKDARTLFEQNMARHNELPIVRAVAEEIAAAASILADREKKRAFIIDSVKQASACERQGDLRRAIAVLQKGLQAFAADPELTRELKRVQALLEGAEREKDLAARAAAIRRELGRGNWQEGLKRIKEAQEGVPGSPSEIADLERQARKLRDHELQSLVEKCREMMKIGNLRDAEKILTKDLARFADEPVVAALASALQEEKLHAGQIQKASSRTGSRQFEEAESILNELAARRPGDPEVSRLRTALETEREQDRNEKLYRAGRAQGDELLRNRKYAEAKAQFEYLLTQFPGDRRLEKDLAGASAAEARSRALTAQQAADAVSDTVGKPRWPASPVKLLAGAGVVLAGLAGAGVWKWSLSNGRGGAEVAKSAGSASNSASVPKPNPPTPETAPPDTKSSGDPGEGSASKVEPVRKSEEVEAKSKADSEAKKKIEAEGRKKAEAEAQRKLEAKKKADLDAQKQAEIETKRKADAEAQKQAEEEALKQAAAAAAKKKASTPPDAPTPKTPPPRDAAAPVNRTIFWEGELKPGEQVSITASSATRGHPRPRMPLYPGVISEYSDGIRVIANPSEANNYTLTIQNASKDPISSFTFKWNRKD